ncbi:hypothetical protein PC9H_011323 [Pleurotus ostreatus]|uniref:Uncharacterized protein n=1 Tax=Pleurotus ostreatus TaxID=5322 RepID=A0A8H7DLC7_PLEOS|nr:uncharacterized protein PC9H_011322 [Pleurotus ostreatus]XP_036626663.1 uncharacterized protein PC9H_011323 [Pleurotus ostreatus]KAF7420804.1 hypothetical protein PC9H_011322 [Pleurotus ostreatus]KAF7420805.1 hypothetical protein PC9H_011323 [Pleurotus ostreatus]KAJ8690223.1 hypothetical protein PTI98_011673 [Pleurotus ostreatus]KAJ8690224.1 hypothetical protein PTI98_011674 [Pleurotus ostreatus]
MSEGTAHIFFIDASAALFNSTVYAVATDHNNQRHKLGIVNAGKTHLFDLGDIPGLRNGDNLRVEIISGQGFENMDTVVITFIKDASKKASFLVTGTATNPNIAFQGLE